MPPALLTKRALPPVLEPSKFTVPSLVMVEVAAVVVLWKFSVADARLLIVALPAEALEKKSIWPPASFVMMTAPASTPSRAVLLFWNTRLLPEVTSKFCVVPELLTMPAALTVNVLPIVME